MIHLAAGWTLGALRPEREPSTFWKQMSATEIQRALAKLPVKERGSVAAWLLETLPPHGSDEGDAEGIEEAARRREEIDSGRVQPISSDEFWAAIARERASWK